MRYSAAMETVRRELAPVRGGPDRGQPSQAVTDAAAIIPESMKLTDAVSVWRNGSTPKPLKIHRLKPVATKATKEDHLTNHLLRR